MSAETERWNNTQTRILSKTDTKLTLKPKVSDQVMVMVMAQNDENMQY
jgi:hypothetical protein